MELDLSGIKKLAIAFFVAILIFNLYSVDNFLPLFQEACPLKANPKHFWEQNGT